MLQQNEDCFTTSRQPCLGWSIHLPGLLRGRKGRHHILLLQHSLAVNLPLCNSHMTAYWICSKPQNLAIRIACGKATILGHYVHTFFANSFTPMRSVKAVPNIQDHNIPATHLHTKQLFFQKIVCIILIMTPPGETFDLMMKSE